MGVGTGQALEQLSNSLKGLASLRGNCMKTVCPLLYGDLVIQSKV